MRNFTAELSDETRKPDEIVVVQINPGTVSDSSEEIGRGIWDRRNQIAGNLSLNQELGFLDAINDRVAKAVQRDDQFIQVLRLPLDRDSLQKDMGNDLGAHRSWTATAS